ncbi:MAG: hypothetical protein ACT4PG_09325 [Panacagrimonas sp.]
MTDYEFTIGAYSPKTIPMARLAEYLTALADLIGEKDRVHFEGLKPGSTVVRIRVQPEARVRSRQRIQEARTADKDHQTYKPYRQLNELLRIDGAEGAITAGGAEIIRFPGHRESLPQVIGPFHKHTEVDGVLVRIGGRDKSAHAQIVDAEGTVWNCEMDRDMARRLVSYLYGAPIRLSGDGRWLRNAEAQWELDRFKATDFRPLDGRSLADAIAAIRKLPLQFDTVATR